MGPLPTDRVGFSPIDKKRNEERNQERAAREFLELVDRVEELNRRDKHEVYELADRINGLGDKQPTLDEIEVGEEQMEEQKRDLIRRIAEKYELGTLHAETENPRNRFKIEIAPNKGLLITCHIANPHSIPENENPEKQRGSMETVIGIRPNGTYTEWNRYASPDYASDIEELFYDSGTGEEMVYTIPVSKEEVDPIEEERRQESRARFGQEWHDNPNWFEENGV